ncbi:MAG: 2-amino-4-hydroxy-6-hydroxymethyldihydropteridine diphosphokinase [Candidatus Malihini olakiniferum]
MVIRYYTINAYTISPLYRIHLLGPHNQPHYLNMVVALEIMLALEDLLDHTREIEQKHRHEYKMHLWRPCTLDLNILLYRAIKPFITNV